MCDGPVCQLVHRRGGALVLASPRPAVAKLLRSAGAHRVIPVYDTVQQATSGRPAIPRGSPLEPARPAAPIDR